MQIYTQAHTHMVKLTMFPQTPLLQPVSSLPSCQTGNIYKYCCCCYFVHSVISVNFGLSILSLLSRTFLLLDVWQRFK